jgi:hypothetical protein
LTKKCLSWYKVCFFKLQIQLAQYNTQFAVEHFKLVEYNTSINKHKVTKVKNSDIGYTDLRKEQNNVYKHTGVIIWAVTIIRFHMTENKEDVAEVKDIVGMMIQIFMGDTIIAVAEVAMVVGKQQYS